MPELPRALPFLVFLGLGALPPTMFSGAEYWIYAAKTIAGAALVWTLRSAWTS
jgi:hypothetical protein